MIDGIHALHRDYCLDLSEIPHCGLKAVTAHLTGVSPVHWIGPYEDDLGVGVSNYPLYFIWGTGVVNPYCHSIAHVCRYVSYIPLESVVGVDA